jgi:membrane fusion protein (multidrug efflux system)
MIRLTRKQSLLTLLTIVLLVVSAFWIYKRSHTVYLDDARGASNIIAISSKVPGWIVKLPISSGQKIEQGELLANIDARQTELALEAIELKIANKQLSIERARPQQQLVGDRVNNQRQSREAALESTKAALNKSESVLESAKLDFDRSKSMWQKKLISAQRWDAAKLIRSKATHAHSEAKAQLHFQQSELKKAIAALKEQEIQIKTLAILQREMQLLEVEKHNTQIQLSDRTIRSPLKNAVIDKTFVHAGEYVLPGRRMVLLHNPADVWIQANARETEIRHIKPGAKARVTVDAYPGIVFEAVVERLDPATTSQFALLPNPTPSGNFTKVTQRLSVRIAIQQKDDLLKPGMMVEVEIDTREPL